MRITDLKAHPILVGGRNQLVVKVETDEGIYGWGEAAFGRELAVDGVLRHFSEFLVGMDPMRRGALWQRLYRSQYAEVSSGVITAAIGAIDIALHDIAGKKLGVPVYELLGGRQRDYVPLFATTAAETGPEMLEQARLLVREGWNVVRLGILGAETAQEPEIFEPRVSLAPTAEWVARIREELGHGVVLGLDYHHRLTVAEAAAFCQMLPAHALDFLEEPIRCQTPAAYEALRRLTPIPFAIGEELASKWDFLPYLEGRLTDFARIDVCTVGGLTEAMKIAGWAEAHYIDLMPHNPLGPIGTAAAAHLALAVPNLAWLEIRGSPTEAPELFYDREIFPVQPVLEDDKLFVSESPGLGVEVSEEALDAPLRFVEQPHLRRRDGSVTNC